MKFSDFISLQGSDIAAANMVPTNDHKPPDRCRSTYGIIINIYAFSSPVHFKGFAWFVLDAHGSPAYPGPFPVEIAKLDTHVGDLPGGLRFGTVFRPELGEGDVLLRKFVDPREVREHVAGNPCCPVPDTEFFSVWY